MGRESILRKDINIGDCGIEIGPWNNPIAPKAEGYKTIVADVFDRDVLVKKALCDPLIDSQTISSIEQVDVVLSGGLRQSVSPYLKEKGIGGLAFIISSHNFEHLPDPLSFLIDCQELLAPNGVLNMAIPIASRCFDALRELSTCGSIIDAYHQGKTRPSLGNIIDHRTSASCIEEENALAPVGPENVQLSRLCIKTNPLCIPSVDYQDKLTAKFGDGYIDTHVSTFNADSFRLIFEDLCALGYLRKMQIESICQLENAQEFIVHIRKLSDERVSFLTQQQRTDLKRSSLESRMKDLYGLNPSSGKSPLDVFAATPAMLRSYRDLLKKNLRKMLNIFNG